MQLVIELKQKPLFKEIENLDNFFLIGERAAFLFSSIELVTGIAVTWCGEQRAF